MSDEFRAKEFAPPFRAPVAAFTSPRGTVRHFLIVGRRETQLHEHLQAALASDSKTIVLLDRRTTDTGPPGGVANRRRPTAVRRPLHFDLVEIVRVEIVRDETGRSLRSEDTVNNGDQVVVDDRERVERWVQDSQYVIGRLIPGMLEDRERWRLKAEAAEQESDRLRFEVATLRKDITEREAERQHIGSEQAAIAEVFTRAMEQLTRLQQPLNDVAHRLHSMQPAGVEVDSRA